MLMCAAILFRSTCYIMCHNYGFSFILTYKFVSFEHIHAFFNLFMMTFFLRIYFQLECRFTHFTRDCRPCSKTIKYLCMCTSHFDHVYNDNLLANFRMRTCQELLKHMHLHHKPFDSKPIFAACHAKARSGFEITRNLSHCSDAYAKVPLRLQHI
jgi:hypothetical protein